MMDMRRKIGSMLILFAFLWLFRNLYHHSLGAVGCFLISIFLAFKSYQQWKQGIRDKK